MPARFSFAEFELDTAAYALRRNGERVRLERLPMELLLLLLEARGAVVDRDRIHETLWGRDVFVDAQAAINTAIRKLRRALHDDSAHPRYIETVPGKGYRFMAPVRESPELTGTGQHAHPQGQTGARARFPAYSVRRGREEFPLHDGDNVVGREPDAQVYLEHPSVSRRHAMISIQQNQVLLHDLESRNGTFLDGRRIDAPSPIHDGAVIGAGPIALTFHVLAGPPSTKPLSGVDAHGRSRR